MRIKTAIIILAILASFIGLFFVYIFYVSNVVTDNSIINKQKKEIINDEIKVKEELENSKLQIDQVQRQKYIDSILNPNGSSGNVTSKDALKGELRQEEIDLILNPVESNGVVDKEEKVTEEEPAGEEPVEEELTAEEKKAIRQEKIDSILNPK